MSVKQVRIGAAVFFLLFGTVTWLGAATDDAPPAGAQQEPSQPASTAVGAVCAAAGSGNCDSDADCPSGQFCYHDPIAFVPYCAPLNGDMAAELKAGVGDAGDQAAFAPGE